MKVVTVVSRRSSSGLIMRHPVLSLAVLAVLASLLSPCIGTLYENVDDLPTLVYDYIVVGVRLFFVLLAGRVFPLTRVAPKAGAAGNVLANRLTEFPNITVLVLEAGITYVGSFSIRSSHSRFPTQ